MLEGNIRKKTLIFLLLLSVIASSRTQVVKAETSNFRQEIYPLTQCNDGIDNDGDGGIDFATDLQCHSWVDETEDIDETFVPPAPPTPPPPPAPPSQTTGSPNHGGGNIFATEYIFLKDIADAVDATLEKYLWIPVSSLLNIPFEIDTSGGIIGGPNGLQRMVIISCCCCLPLLFIFLIIVTKKKRRIEKRRNRLDIRNRDPHTAHAPSPV
jgi:hypothetical protein